MTDKEPKRVCSRCKEYHQRLVKIDNEFEQNEKLCLSCLGELLIGRGQHGNRLLGLSDIKKVAKTWQDTVLSLDNFGDFGTSPYFLEVIKESMKEQAEVAFKARQPEIDSLLGQIADLKELKSQAELTERKAGMKEVVEWIQSNIPSGYDQWDNEKPLYLLYIDRELWEGFLKSEGIE